MDSRKFVREAFVDADLLQGYADKALEQLELLRPEERGRVADVLSRRVPKNAEEAGAIAVLQFTISQLGRHSPDGG